MTKKNLFTFIFFAALFICCFNFCKTKNSSYNSNKYLNLQDSVNYVGMATCRSCHDNVHKTFSQTGMGRSFHYATPEKSDAIFDKHALVYDTLNDFYYFPYFSKNKNDTALYVMEFRLSKGLLSEENGDTVHKRIEKINYIVGSGQHTNSHIIDINGYIYQAPITWYTQEKKWDLAPGFRENNSRFDRWLTDECITCHNHFPRQIAGSLNKFSDMPTGIECERCHGPGEVHARKMLAGNIVDTSANIDYSIVTPSDLPRDLQMDICQRCHLQGVAITEPGKTFFDFRPGMELNKVMNVFLPRFTDSHEKFIMASQADRLRLSECFKNDETLTCLSCHHPHHSVEVTPKEKYNNACKNCHQEKKCTLPFSERAINNNDCSNCHMPKSGSTDIPHVSITDHMIAVSNQKPKTLNQKPKSFLGIEILTKENPTPLDMARGYLATYDKFITASIMLDSAFYYLEKTNEKPEFKIPVLIHYLFSKNNFGEIINEAKKLPDGFILDAWTAYRIGEAYLQNGDFNNALIYFSKAEIELPLHLDFLEKKGIALMALKRIKEAKVIFNKIIYENPKRPIALCNLGFAYALTGNMLEAEKLYDQAISLDPDYAQALINKAALLAFKKNKNEARKLLLRVLKKEPENGQALEGLKKLVEQ